MERTVVASTRVCADGERAAKALRHDASAVLGGTRIELVATIGRAPAVRHEIELAIDEPVERDGAVVVPVRWHAVGRERLFPRFSGALVLQPDGDAGALLQLRGTYAVPLGAVGRFGDGLAGRRVARRCVEDLVKRVAANIDAAAGVTADTDADDGVLTYAVTVHEELDAGR